MTSLLWRGEMSWTTDMALKNSLQRPSYSLCRTIALACIPLFPSTHCGTRQWLLYFTMQFFTAPLMADLRHDTTPSMMTMIIMRQQANALPIISAHCFFYNLLRQIVFIYPKSVKSQCNSILFDPINHQ